jgi:hypothetical protein
VLIISLLLAAVVEGLIGHLTQSAAVVVGLAVLELALVYQ